MADKYLKNYKVDNFYELFSVIISTLIQEVGQAKSPISLKFQYEAYYRISIMKHQTLFARQLRYHGYAYSSFLRTNDVYFYRKTYFLLFEYLFELNFLGCNFITVSKHHVLNNEKNI